ESSLMSKLVRGDPDGVPVPGRPDGLSLWVYSSGLDGSLAAGLLTAAGRKVYTTFGSLGFQGWSSLQAPLSDLAATDYPVRLRTLSLRSTGPRSTGEIALSELRAGDAVIDDLTRAGGWWEENV